MTNQTAIDNIIRRRMHGLYLSRRCGSLETLAHERVEAIIWKTRGA